MAARMRRPGGCDGSFRTSSKYSSGVCGGKFLSGGDGGFGLRPAPGRGPPQPLEGGSLAGASEISGRSFRGHDDFDSGRKTMGGKILRA
jgi:hypothetical protein